MGCGCGNKVTQKIQEIKKEQEQKQEQESKNV